MNRASFGILVVLVVLGALVACSPGSQEPPADGSGARAPSETEAHAGETEAHEADPEAASAARNPFGVPDIRDEYFGDDVDEWLASIEMPAAADDPNAEAWAVLVDPDAGEGIDGRWAGRWRTADMRWREGTADIRTVGQRVFVLFTDQGDEIRYLIEAEIDGDTLVGVYQNLVNDFDSAPWAGRVVSGERIDGYWPLGRWDFRRRTRRP